MKNYKKLFLINMIIIGLSALLFLLYNNFLSLAYVAASVSEGTYQNPTTIQYIAKLVCVDSLIAIVLYVIAIIVNYIFIKKEMKKCLITSTIIYGIILIILIVSNIFLF